MLTHTCSHTHTHTHMHMHMHISTRMQIVQNDSSTPLRDPLFAEFRDFAKTVLGHEWGRQGADVAETLRKFSHGPGPHSGKIWAPGAPREATKIAKNKISENL